MKPRPIEIILRPLLEFTKLESASSILLILCTTLALLLANSPWHEAVQHFWEIPIEFHLGSIQLHFSLHHFINDALMGIFFFVVGLEIKREFLIGELASRKKAMLPIIAALGGMLVPALFYALFNASKDSAPGWGIPMATDIAFAIAILGILGPKVPWGLKVFLTALAIVDDLGAVLVIAIFYTSQLSIAALAMALACVLLMTLMNRLDVRHPLAYFIVGIIMWFFVLNSGVHATVAGVLAAMCIPASTRIHIKDFRDTAKLHLDKLDALDDIHSLEDPLQDHQQATLVSLEDLLESVQAPLQKLIHLLHPWIAYIIMPLFALANAGVRVVDLNLSQTLHHPISYGVFLGLVIGKPIGITLFAWLGTILHLSELPRGANMKLLHCISYLGGIGFTMSLFVTNLAFNNPAYIDIAKLSILSASLLASILGFVLTKRSVAK